MQINRVGRTAQQISPCCLYRIHNNRHHHQNRPVNDYVQNVQHNQRDIHQMTTEIHKISEDIINI